MSKAPELLLAHHLKTLRLPTFLREHDKQARICAAEGLDHVRYLARLTELELIDRERRMVERRIKSAKFPAVKSLDSFDFKAIPSLNKMMVLELARCEWIERRENVIALGPSGTGKTHIALGLGLAACQKGLPVAFVNDSVGQAILSVDFKVKLDLLQHCFGRTEHAMWVTKEKDEIRELRNLVAHGAPFPDVTIIPKQVQNLIKLRRLIHDRIHEETGA